MRASKFDVRRYRSRTAPQGRAAEPPTVISHASLSLSVAAGTTRDSATATLVPPTVRAGAGSRARSRLSHRVPPEPRRKPPAGAAPPWTPQPKTQGEEPPVGRLGACAGAVRVRAGRRPRRGRTVGPAHHQLLMVGAVGSGVDPRPEALVRSFARACVLRKREHLADTCFDLGFYVGECVGGDTLNCGNVLGVPHRHPYLPSVLGQICIVAGGETFPGSAARIRCVGVDTKVPRQRVQICQLSLDNC